ncbi:uncharacterized protein LOC133780073 [Humulus lupulus]|uniref:uncharacterized protein LOC133780073 n=1 Tax=Humulus lupulus TaxID=3486 RepID=UPI002B408EFE|nr:uncharacterized protein LOC133780073 [Humulus lupulus]
MREQCEYVNVEDIVVHESDSSFVFDDEFVETEYVGTTDNEDWLVEERKIMGELSNSESETNIQDVIVQNLEDDDCEEELDEEQKCALKEMKRMDSTQIEKKKPIFSIFNYETHMANPSFRVGMVFKNAKVFREAIHQYGIKNGRDISFPRNDKDIIRSKFKGNCPWVLYASQFDSKNPTLKVKTYVNKHACGRINTNTNATSTWIPKTYSESLQPGKQFSCGDFLAKVTKDFRITITKTQVYKVKKKGAIFLEGSMKDQYGKLWDYAEELRARNLGKHTFKRIYVCLAARRRGWKSGCRPIIGLDACNTKGLYKTQILLALGIDADNSYYPIAYAIAEKETFATWKWFLQYLQVDLDLYNSSSITFLRIQMADKRDDKEKHQKKERNIQNPERYQVWLRSLEKNKVLVTELDQQIAKKIWFDKK